MPVSATPVTATPGKLPHLAEIGDFHTGQAMRLLNDKVQTLVDRLTAAEGTIAALVAQVNTLETNLTAARRKADEALGTEQGS